MRYLAPYQTGLWLAEYLDIRCQLCRVYRSTPQSQLAHAYPSQSAGKWDDTAYQFLSTRSFLITKYRQHNEPAF